jgi:outer membrane protein assembly factor BamD (BamD/ComL family)
MTPRIALMLLVLLSATACHQRLPDSLPFFGQRSLSARLADAREALQERQYSQAMALLTEIAAAPGVAGITDEALARLALLHLRGGQERDQAQALRLIERLAKEYPESQWTPLVAPVADLVNRNQSLNRENQSLTRDNRTLKQNIQKIKDLELQLEQAPGR